MVINNNYLLFFLLWGEAVTLVQWYELRVAGSPGTQAGTAQGSAGGIAIAENGRMCAISSGHARKFESKAAAIDYLGKIKVSGDHQFEAVLCGVRAAT